MKYRPLDCRHEGLSQRRMAGHALLSRQLQASATPRQPHGHFDWRLRVGLLSSVPGMKAWQATHTAWPGRLNRRAGIIKARGDRGARFVEVVINIRRFRLCLCDVGAAIAHYPFRALVDLGSADWTDSERGCFAVRLRLGSSYSALCLFDNRTAIDL
jgi:hypothetical protein